MTLKRAARVKGTFYVEPEPKLLFVMRLRGINGMHPKTRHIMKVLRLLQIHNGVFMKVAPSPPLVSYFCHFESHSLSSLHPHPLGKPCLNLDPFTVISCLSHHPS